MDARTFQDVTDLCSLVTRGARLFGDATALELPEVGEAFTYRELASSVFDIANWLEEVGVRDGERIAVALPNRSEIPLLLLAAARLGAATFALNTSYKSNELTYFLELLQPKIFVTWAEFLDQHQHVIFGKVKAVFLVDEPRPDCRVFSPKRRDCTVEMSEQAGHVVSFGFSSGSTGMPKAVPRTQGQWMQIARNISGGMVLTRSDRVATAQPLYYGDPLYCFFASILSGSTMIMLDRFRSQTFVELLVRTRTTKILTIGVVPTMIMNTRVSDVERDLCLEVAWSVGIPREIHGDLEKRFRCPWLEVYGTVETATVFMERGDGSFRHEPGSGWVGSAVPGVEVRLIGSAGEVIEGDGQGILEVRGGTVMQGYYNAPEETAKVLSDDRWYRTGDKMERQDGRYRFLNREKDIVRRSGESISATEVESVFRQARLVLDCAVVPLPDPIRGEEIWIFLMPVDGCTVIDLEVGLDELLAFASVRLAKHKVPRYVSVLSSFPRTPTQRVIKKELPGLAGRRLFDNKMGKWLSVECVAP